MANEKGTGRVEFERIISSYTRELNKCKDPEVKTTKIIHTSENGEPQRRKVRIIGGDSDENVEAVPPTIIIEKTDDDQISKIIVKCPCGRHAELVCVSEEEQEAGQDEVQ